MFNRRTLTIIKRELKEKLFSKSFVLLTLLLPVFMFMGIGIQALIMTVKDEEHSKIMVISPSEKIISKFQNEISNSEKVKKKVYSVTFEKINEDKLTEFVNLKKADILEDRLSGIVFIPDSALSDKKVEYYSKNPNNNQLFNFLKIPINKALLGIYFENKNINLKDLNFASNNVDITGFRVTKENKVEEEGYGNLITFFVFTFLLYISLVFIGTIIMRSVVQEKTNRIVEVMLSSVNSKELITGKIIGTAVMGVAQMAIWLSPVILLISTTWFVLPPEITLKINMNYVLYFLLNCFVGLLTFLGLFAAGGAIFDNEQDSQSVVFPILMLIMIPFFIALTMQDNAGSSLIKIASLVPFSSIMVMPARMVLIEVAPFEVILSFLINIITMILVFMLAGKIYRVGILMTGKKPKWSEIVKWVKYKY
jgi:ABC-2 type transport system permease protein